MKLYYSPGACSLSPHIVLRETGATFDLEQVDLKTKQTKAGADFTKINPKGYVPALQLDDGSILTEGPAIVQYLADKAPNAGLLPKAGSVERARTQEWLNFISTELHKGFGPLFSEATPADYKDVLKGNLGRRFDYVEKHLAAQAFLTGGTFSVADAYAFTVLGWAKYVGIDLAKWPNLTAYVARVAARPHVQAAMKAEGLI